HLVQLHDLDFPARSRGRPTCGRRGAAGSGGTLDVFGDDSTLGARAAERGELDASFPRDPARERRSLDPASVRLGRRRSGLRLRLWLWLWLWCSLGLRLRLLFLLGGSRCLASGDLFAFLAA